MYLHTDHFLVEMQIRMRLIAISETRNSIPKILKPIRRQWQQYNEFVIVLCLSSIRREHPWQNLDNAVSSAIAQDPI